ncbi:MAG: group III truncated hemoglobin [Ferruginibacter sp.]|nr:group III truncated hemoglobin [Chitinophagaceae bacterium]
MTHKKSDIENREDLMMLVRQFYHKLLADPSISYIFTDIARIDPEQHFPVLVDFWDMVLFQHDTYRKNAMQVHLDLNQETPLMKAHFDTWLKYFSEAVDELFEGEKAFLAKQRALSIATAMQIKIIQQKNL